MSNLKPENSQNAMAGLAKRAGTHISGLWHNRRGVAAIEFAMVVPLLLCMSFLSMEVGQGIETSRKLGRSAAMIGLVATQQSGSVTRSELEAMMLIGDASLQPYGRSKGSFTVSGVKVSNDATPVAKVVWSRSLTNGAASAGRTKGEVIQIPDAMRTAGTFLVVTEARLDYKPMIAWTNSDTSLLGLSSAFSLIKMGDTSYQVTRDLNLDIVCADC